MRKVLYMVIVGLGCMVGCYGQEVRAKVNVGSFNLRMDTPSDGKNAWEYRKEVVKGLIQFHEFDILGTQEGFRHMLKDIEEIPNYKRIGMGRDGGDEGEHSAIFYREDKFALLDSGNFWYSETPNVVSKGWDAKCCNRLCSWGKFRDMETGKEFYVFSSHFDHEGKVARRESSKLLLRKIKEIAGEEAVVFAVGDFNAVPWSEPVRTILDEGTLRDAYEVSEGGTYGCEGTYHAYKYNPSGAYRIDYVFVSGGISVKQYGSLNETPNGVFPSDHFPILVRAEF